MHLDVRGKRVVVALSVDLLAVVRASREALPFIVAGRDPAIINIASGSGLNPSVRAPAYGAAKAAVIHYTRTQAAALAMKGIRVNCVAPGYD
jgi:3-oxoacyl-[acyl-carrier protein] reductase